MRNGKANAALSAFHRETADIRRQGSFHLFCADRGAALGLDFNAMVTVVSALSPGDFYKSMTTNADHRIWLDVYRRTTQVGEVYLKLTVIDDVLIVSFKEL